MNIKIEKTIEFEELSQSNLIVDAVYKSGNNGNMSDEVLSKLMMCENSGGFRKRGSINPFNLNYVVLYSTNKNKNWINNIDWDNKRVYYYGDNLNNETNMLDTPKKGNLILKNVFSYLNENNRDRIPPFFIFTSEKGRDVKFRGLLVPGDDRLVENNKLVEVVNKVNGKKIKNYKAVFTILDIKEIDRRWIEDLVKGYKNSIYAPYLWNEWVKNNKQKLSCEMIINKNIVLDNNDKVVKAKSDTNFYEHEIITIPASGTIDLIYKYRIHAHPINGNYPYKKSLYYTFREKYGWMKNIYTLKGTVEIYPQNIDSIKIIENEEITLRIKGYIEERYKLFGFSNEGKYKFYILENQIELPNKIRIANQNNHSYITISEAYSGNIDVKRSNKDKIIKKDEIDNKIEIKNIDNFIEIENEQDFIEGQKFTKLIESKKRNSSIRQIKLDIARKQLGQAACEICGENDEVVLDIHHEKVKVAEMEENHTTKLSDLKILCANCHRRIHGYKLTFTELIEKNQYKK